MFKIDPCKKIIFLWTIIHMGILMYSLVLIRSTGSLKCVMWFCATSYFNLSLYGIIQQERIKYKILPMVSSLKDTINKR